MVDDAVKRIARTGSTFRPHVEVWLDDIERTVLQYVARERPRSPHSVRRALESIAEPKRIQKALEGLEIMGLVESSHGEHRVRIPLFERWITANLDPPPHRQVAIRQQRAKKIVVGCTIAALLVGAYVTVLRSTRSASVRSLGDCAFELDYPDRIGPAETFELLVYQHCATLKPHQLAIQPVLSALRIPAGVSDCTTVTTSCIATFSPVAGQQADDTYRDQLLVEAQPLMLASITKDRFATWRAIGEKTALWIASLQLVLNFVIAFHKELKRSVLRLLGLGDAAGPEPPSDVHPHPTTS
jgi:hypothetical protein